MVNKQALEKIESSKSFKEKPSWNEKSPPGAIRSFTT